MAALISRWNGRVTTWLARLAAGILAVLAVITFCDVIARYFFNAPFSFTVEMTELAMGMIVYLAIGLTTHDEEHITVDIVTLRLSQWVRALFSLFVNLVALVFLAVMVWRVWLRAAFLLDKGDVTPIWHMPIWPVAFVMAAGGVFLLTGVLVHLLRSIGQVRGGQETP
jgi:TRAP-type C4-dicarboxylate transport system permease small subunit